MSLLSLLKRGRKEVGSLIVPVGPFPRDMTKEEFDRLGNGCLFCHSHNVYEGPSGGLSTNFICEDCGSRYNLTPVAPPFGCEIIHGPKEG